jgi:hypothetical protein
VFPQSVFEKLFAKRGLMEIRIFCGELMLCGLVIGADELERVTLEILEEERFGLHVREAFFVDRQP